MCGRRRDNRTRYAALLTLLLMLCSCTTAGLRQATPRKAPVGETTTACLAQPTARCLRAEAYAMARAISNPPLRDELMMRIAANQLLHGDLGGGMRSATRIQNLSLRYGLLARVHGDLMQSAPGRARALNTETRRLNQTHLPYNRAIGDFYLTLMALTEKQHAGALTTEMSVTLIERYLERYARDPQRMRAQFAIGLFDKGFTTSAYHIGGSVSDLHWRALVYAHFLKGGADMGRLTPALDALADEARRQQRLSALQQLSAALAHRGRFERAVALTHAITHVYYRAQGLSDLASVAASQLRPSLAKRLWQQALALNPQADAQRPEHERSTRPPVTILVAEAMKQLATAYAWDRQFDKAVRQSEAIAALSPVLSDACYARLASEMALAGEFSRAQRAAARIIGRQKRELALANVAIRMHAGGDHDRAFRLIFSLSHRAAVDHALGEIAVALARQGDWERARLLTAKIRLAFKYADTLNRLSVLFAAAPQTESVALATPTHMRIIRPFVLTRP